MESDPKQSDAVTSITTEEDFGGLGMPEIAVDLFRPLPIGIAMVPVAQLKALEQSASDEQQACGFCLAFGGAALAAILASMVSAPVEKWRATYWSVTVILFAATLWTGITWLRRHAQKKSCFAELMGATSVRYIASPVAGIRKQKTS